MHKKTISIYILPVILMVGKISEFIFRASHMTKRITNICGCLGNSVSRYCWLWKGGTDLKMGQFDGQEIEQQEALESGWKEIDHLCKKKKKYRFLVIFFLFFLFLMTISCLPEGGMLYITKWFSCSVLCVCFVRFWIAICPFAKLSIRQSSKGKRPEAKKSCFLYSWIFLGIARRVWYLNTQYQYQLCIQDP